MTFFFLHVNSNSSKILTEWSDKKVTSKQQTPRARPCKYAGQLGYGMAIFFARDSPDRNLGTWNMTAQFEFTEALQCFVGKPSESSPAYSGGTLMLVLIISHRGNKREQTAANSLG